ncbi:hypothetical protein [Xanthomonas sp. MUS 060]|uniref:hypothetical protein n=1 Tax=Xanthomonas sp. MUS 060 TaxID=1588031 RepID=UPI0005F282ED|nr:hypothetical protein [Xanthomonas sp. MUS 060]
MTRKYFPPEILRRWQWWVSIPAVLVVAAPWLLIAGMHLIAHALDHASGKILTYFNDSILHKALLVIQPFAIGESNSDEEES